MMFVKMKDHFRLKWRQYLAACLVSYGSLCSGMALSWTSPVFPKLHGPNSPLSREPTLQEESWIGSLFLLGGLIGPFITIGMSRHVGRKWVIVSSNLPLVLGWLIAGLASDLPAMYAARCLWGVANSMHFATIPLYIGEIAEDEIRGTLSSLFLTFINLGFLLSYAIGPFTTYWGLTATGGVLSLLYVPFSCLIPETPFFLVYKGRNEEAASVLVKLRGRSKDEVQIELEGLQALVEREFKVEPKIQDLWATRGGLKALGIGMFLTSLVQLVGINVMLFYMEELLAKIGTTLSPAEGTIIVGAVQLVTSCITPLVVDRLGRKLLMWTCCLGLTIILTVIGQYALMDTYLHYDVTPYACLPLVCLVIYMIFFTLGVGPVPWILMAEMFPVKTKCLASGICSFMCWLVGFVWTRFFRDIAAWYGIYTAFWILAVCCGIGFVFSVTLLPETKGRTFDQIQDMLHNRTKDPKSTDATRELNYL